jgi:23S rRNA (adenine2503-C2)-methyltransferase
MPVNERYPLPDVIAACEAYYARKRRKVFVEYVMLAGVNDSWAQAAQLAEILDPRLFKVNLIPYNPTGSRFTGSSPKAIGAFREELERRGLSATVRLTRGREIDAACGQLAARASPAWSSRSRSSASSSGEGSNVPSSGSSSSELSPNSRRNSSLVR